MSSQALSALIASIAPVDKTLAKPAQAHLDSLTKPQGSLGRLEEAALRLYMIQQGAAPKAAPAKRKKSHT